MAKMLSVKGREMPIEVGDDQGLEGYAESLDFILSAIENQWRDFKQNVDYN